MRTFPHFLAEVEQGVLSALIAAVGMASVFVIPRVHTVNVVRLGLEAVVVGCQRRVNVILMQFDKPRHGVDDIVCVL